MGKRMILAGAVLTSVFSSTLATAQVQTKVPPVVAGARAVTVQRIKVHAPSIEGNLEGESADRDVIVVLPPDYATARKKRYPVIYALHGYSIGAEQWINEIHVPQVVEGAFALGTQPMILVLPDSKTLHNGSMYSSSPTTGDFERFVAQDLVAYVDTHYRTLARQESRGLVGHSMGGYGASRIGMKHADVFGAVYMMSPCCLSARDTSLLDAGAVAQIERLKTREAATTLPWGLRATLAAAAAWSPNPKAPPFYLDLPIKDGKPRQDVLAKWAANAPLAFIDQYIGNLRRYRAIAIDVGDKDGLRVDAQALHEVLDRYGLANSFTIYPGDHTSAVADRFQNYVLPFFSKNLMFTGKR
ncbi:alpha/beta hydrolase [Sphingomonas elodea]|uniref:alpha/beta hydrolase n=1 Tax=Sphingomonas elodea TaxID=179878 RepID=UPI000263160A|nr:alpha/beta fold hydrolase [Sphingomonas elodea]